MKNSDEMVAKVSSKGWVVIPAAIRRKLGIKPGTRIKIKEAGDRIILLPESKNPVQECFGKFSGKPSLTKALLKEREEERQREKRKGIRA